ncbi:MAG TPA: hypothetical protein DCX37_01455 [Firmicutes bacterium]|jgi:hypothetical protein|nr:hypothetical protein [Bacillota bacterium]HBG42993.1 hypothetical protein [Bacillota bacterium]HBL67235.1 hypothetical protein [Bacillota bacterium]
MSRKNRALLLIMLALAVITLTGCGEPEDEVKVPKGNLQGTISYKNIDPGGVAGYANHAQVTMSGTGLPVRSAYTDANGQYLISDVLVGSYDVIACFATATNISSMDFPLDFYYGEYSLNYGAHSYCDLTGPYPNLSLSLGNVVIADATTTTLDFFLYGY